MNWTAETRKAYKESNPNDWGDVERSLFPIKTQDDVDSAARLLGKAKDPEAVKSRIIAIAKRLGLTIPDAWQAKATAEFRTVSADGQTVTRKGRIWRSGDYPDKQFEMTPEDNWAAVEAFTGPVPVDLEHTPTVLDGRLGELRSVALSADATEIEGEVVLPLWLDEALGEEPIRVSCTWDRDSKTLCQLALVRNPRVTDAAVMSAFAAFAAGDTAGKPGAPRHDTPSGQGFHQMVHDLAASSGAKCDRGNSVRMDQSVEMQSGHELAGIQAIHDTAVEHGAACARMGGRANYSAGSGGGLTMKLWERMKQALGSAGEVEVPADAAGAAVPVAPAPTAAAPVPPVQMTAAPAVPDPQVAILQAQVTALQQAGREAAAVAFAQETVRSGRALPAEAGALAALYVQAATDDGAVGGVVTFGQDATGKAITGSRVDALKAATAARPINKLVSDGLATNLQALFNLQHTPGMDAAADEKAANEKAAAQAKEWGTAANGRK